jgi:ABC-type glutathione transport system ATPase component
MKCPASSTADEMAAMSGIPGALLAVEELRKSYDRTGRWGAGKKRQIIALDGVTFSIREGSTLAIVGESGSGKSTLVQCVACLEQPTSGRIILQGEEISGKDERELRRVRPRIQIVFQDPSRSLNARFTAMEIVSEPLKVQAQLNPAERDDATRRMMAQVGIPREKALQRMDEFSGGQKQRLALARALTLKPELLILDEALSGLDGSIQAQIANLLLDLQESLGLTYLFITHDLEMAGYLADEIAVMERGRIVEQGVAEKILRLPEHEMTRRLIAATPGMNAAAGAPRVA